ncbi:MAG: hypothetical protein IKL03_09375, partial [Bacteroidaceae bacterium]|nr:hypothetical protein [Bacteroidaceae bacterium]
DNFREADERVLWYASLCGNRPWDCILCSEAYEKALWLASLWGKGVTGHVRLFFRHVSMLQ